MPPDRRRSQPLPPVVVLGRPGLLRDLVVRLLTSSGGQVGSNRSSTPAVQLLVEPEAPDWLEARSSKAPIILVAPNLSDDAVIDAVVGGAAAVFSEDISGGILREAVTTAHGGGTFLSPRQVTLLAERTRALDESRSPGTAIRLTARERQILLLIARGLSVKQTSIEIAVSPKTVENLQSRLYRKLGVRNRAQAVRRGHALGLLHDDLET